MQPRFSSGRLALSVGAAAIATAVLARQGFAQPRPAPPTAAHTAAPSAQDVAGWVQRFYDQTRSLEATFEQHFWTRVYQRTQSSRGRIRIQRPGRIRFDYTNPQGKVVVTNAREFVYYEPGDGGEAGQYARGATSDSASTALGFLTGTSQILRDFRVTLRPPMSTTPSGVTALELRPRRSDPRIVRVVLYVENQDAVRGVVRRVAIEDPDGNWNRFDFANFAFNRPVGADVFNFTPPAGARQMQAPH